MTLRPHLAMLLFFIVSMALLRALISPYFGLGVDEAHYLLYGVNLDLSYFDHPPLVGWTQAIFSSIFGINEFSARVGAILIGAICSIFVYFWLIKIFNSSKIALVGAVALNASFMFSALFVMFMPETLLFLLIIPILYIALEIEKHNKIRDWVLLGVLLGAAGLSKYTAFLFVIALIIYFLLKRRFDLFINIKLLLAISISSLMILPIIIWNIDHDWISFAFQSSHVGGKDEFRVDFLAESLAVQFGAYSPFLAPLAYYGLYKSFRSPNNPALLISAIFGSVLMLFFTYNSAFAVALPHWSALFYMLFIPIGVGFLMQSGKTGTKYVYGAVALSLLIVLLLYAELRFKFLPFKPYHSLHRDLYGWDQITKEADALILDPSTEALAVANWSLASRAIYYARAYSFQTYLIDDRYDQFDIWQEGSPLDKDLLFISTHDFNIDISKKMNCSSTKLAKKFDIMLNSTQVNTIELIWCRDFGGKK